MDDQVKKNMEQVQALMSASTKNAALQQGNKALVPVPIDYTADSGNTFKGVVVFRRPSAMDYIRMGAAKSELMRIMGIQPILIEGLNGQLVESMAHVDNSFKYLANAIGTCDVLLVEPRPEWLKNHRDIEDTDLLLEVYDRFQEALASFRTGATGGPAADGEAGSSPAPVDNPEDLRQREADGGGRDSSAE